MDGTWLRRNLRFLLRDLLVTAAFTMLFFLTAPRWSETQVPAHQAIDAAGYALLAAIAAGMLVRRWLPLYVLGAQSLLVGALLAAGYPHGPYFLAVAITGLTVGRTSQRRVAAAGAICATILIATGELTSFLRGYTGGGWDLSVGLGVVLLFGVLPVVGGVLLREHRAWRAKAEEETTRRRVDDERLRMAREVHDVVGHSLSIISLQAGVALHVLDRRPEQAQLSLEAIRRTAIEALDELRATLALTRAGQFMRGSAPLEPPLAEPARPEPSPADQAVPAPRAVSPPPPSSATERAAERTADRTPLTGLGRLPSLLAEVRLCGIPVEASTSGPLDTLPADVDLAAYRIVQESLTNVLRHAAASRVTIEVTVSGGAVSIDVADAPDPPAAQPVVPPGHGLTGLRERAEELGGRLTAGPCPGGGWRVRAQLPVTRARPVGGPGGSPGGAGSRSGGKR
ncbi:sensor histidine kinase [Pseudofrankia saprophytica]|uniref:sensor histidine kinase n=1 Tax=Pseudofrankia saprophytica TaxID=298655 RepID=UPI000686E9CD|nr:sensor histidine kinase [Pseudofrankia saprophytica]